MILYKISFDCAREAKDNDEPYRIEIAIDKIGVLQAVSPLEKVIGG
jgi:hypothetical protein